MEFHRRKQSRDVGTNRDCHHYEVSDILHVLLYISHDGMREIAMNTSFLFERQELTDLLYTVRESQRVSQSSGETDR